MSSVESILPMFGVSGGRLPRQRIAATSACPSTICCAPRPTGGNTMTSYFALRFGVLRDDLRADVVVRDLQAVERHAATSPRPAC